jgi:hypothetical protein
LFHQKAALSDTARLYRGTQFPIAVLRPSGEAFSILSALDADIGNVSICMQLTFVPACPARSHAYR